MAPPATSDASPVRAGPDAPPALPAVRSVAVSAPFAWLAAGARDFAATGFVGAFYGAAFALMGWTILAVYDWTWQYAWSLTAGFFLVGPFLCVGIYWLSRQRERGESVSLRDSLTCWRGNAASIGWLASMLAFVFIIWGRVSAVFFALVSSHDFASLDHALARILSLDNAPYLAVWTLVAAAFGALALAVGAVSMPLATDRRLDTIPALITSVRAFWRNPAPMLLWGLVVLLLIAPSLAFGFVGLLITAPLVGHATWHAYRALVD